MGAARAERRPGQHHDSGGPTSAHPANGSTAPARGCSWIAPVRRGPPRTRVLGQHQADTHDQTDRRRHGPRQPAPQQQHQCGQGQGDDDRERPRRRRLEVPVEGVRIGGLDVQQPRQCQRQRTQHDQADRERHGIAPRRRARRLVSPAAAGATDTAGGDPTTASRAYPDGRTGATAGAAAGSVGGGRGGVHAGAAAGAGAAVAGTRRVGPVRGGGTPTGATGAVEEAICSTTAAAAEDTDRLSSDASVPGSRPRRSGRRRCRHAQVAELLHGAQPLRRDGALDGVLEVGGQLPVHVAGDQDPAVDVLLLLRALLRHLRDHPVVDVAVELVERDVAVLVQVGGATADRVDQVAGEHRRRARAAEVVALEGVLGRVGGGQDGASLALEALEGLHALVGLRRASGGRRRCSSSRGSAPCAASARRPRRR